MDATVTLKNPRLRFLLGINTGYAVNGDPDERCIEFYRRRSSPLLHCAIVGNVVLPAGHGTNASTAMLSRAPVWSDLARQIANRGSLPGIQLTTAWRGYVGSRSFRPQEGIKTIGVSRELVEELGSGGIRSALASLADAADMAVAAGFRHLQVHAAHGYLFSLLVDHRINRSANAVIDQPSALTKMDHVVLTRVDPGSMTKITRGAAARAA